MFQSFRITLSQLLIQETVDNLWVHDNIGPSSVLPRWLPPYVLNQSWDFLTIWDIGYPFKRKTFVKLSYTSILPFWSDSVSKKVGRGWLNQSVNQSTVEQPLASPGSAKYIDPASMQTALCCLAISVEKSGCCIKHHPSYQPHHLYSQLLNHWKWGNKPN